MTTTLEEAETKDWLKNPVMANALLPEEEGDGQSSDAVADIRILFCGHTSDPPADLDDFAVEQRKDPEILEIIEHAENGTVPEDAFRARRLVSEGSVFVIVGGIAYYVDPKRENRRRAIVPQQLRKRILANTHSSRFAGHFSGRRLYDSLLLHWWWRGMFQDATAFARSCPECAVATGAGRRIKPPLQPIPVSRPFQILGIDIMDLPLTDRGNSHVVVVQDLFTKWPFAFPVPDQKTERIARLLVEEVIPCFGVPEVLLSDRGTNLLSHLMLDMCKMMGIDKINTTAYHPQCDGAVERFRKIDHLSCVSLPGLQLRLCPGNRCFRARNWSRTQPAPGSFQSCALHTHTL